MDFDLTRIRNVGAEHFRACIDRVAMSICPECGEMKGLLSLYGFVVRELVAELAHDLDTCAETTSFDGPSSTLVKGFTDILLLLRAEIEVQSKRRATVAIPLCENCCGAQASIAEEITCLHGFFLELLSKSEKYLVEIESHLHLLKERNDEAFRIGYCKYFCLLDGLGHISKIQNDWEEVFWETLKRRKSALSFLIVKYVKRDDVSQCWILEYKEVINFEARRHLAMTMLPEVEHDPEAEHEILISRQRLLEESFEYIAHADPQSLRAGLSVVFENEKATGHGVLREWFFLVCQEMVNPLNSLFLACPNDRSRFFPNPESGVDPLHLEYFSFCGRVIALALMHKVQVGIVFDRIFFLQLAGYSISLEDMRDADPFFYKSCKHILEMDPEAVDQDDLGLTFVHEIEELGTRKVVELFPSGTSMAVNSKNRNEFVDSLIKHRFVTAISEQVAHFARGFSDIMNCLWSHKAFFCFLDLEDLDWMLQGSESAISVEDWKGHTDYHGFKETDPQISWFWEIVGLMSVEQKRALLFFWTSIKYLPVEGFGGLASRLHIDKTAESDCWKYVDRAEKGSSLFLDVNKVPPIEGFGDFGLRLCFAKSAESRDLLPFSRTCFYQLDLPDYSSFDVMRDTLNIITQEHVGCSFGEL